MFFTHHHQNRIAKAGHNSPHHFEFAGVVGSSIHLDLFGLVAFIFALPQLVMQLVSRLYLSIGA